MCAMFTYSSIDNKWNQYASKGDRIQFSSQGQVYQAVVDSASVSSVLATILNTHKQIELKHGSFQFVERRMNTTTSIPIENGDLVSFITDAVSYTGIVSNVDANSSLADVDVISNVKIGKLQIPVNKLSYLAKGYIFGNPNAASAGTANTAPQTPSVVSAQNASQIALLYPAPCVVMAVPYNTNPDSFPEAMYVQMPDRNPGQPVLLPVVRMGCDTALVVIPPNKGRGPATVTTTQVKATPVPRPNNIGV
ncbi:hypothetical protein WA171_003546 [Blastocystis sp. BT1]